MTTRAPAVLINDKKIFTSHFLPILLQFMRFAGVKMKKKVGNLTGVKDLTNSKSDHEGHSTIDIKAIIKMILKTIIPNS